MMGGDNTLLDALMHIFNSTSGDGDGIPLEVYETLVAGHRDPNFSLPASVAHCIVSGIIPDLDRFNTLVGIKNYDNEYGLCLRKLCLKWGKLNEDQQDIIFGAFWTPLGEKISTPMLSLLVSELVTKDFDIKLMDTLLSSVE